MHYKNRLLSIAFIFSVICGAFLLIQCSEGPSDQKNSETSPEKVESEVATSTDDQKMEEDFYIIVNGGALEDRKLDLSTSIMMPGWTHMNSSNITQAKIVGGYTEGSDFGTATLTLLFPKTMDEQIDFLGRGDFLRGNPGLSLSTIEILGLPQMEASKGTITINNYPEEEGDWLSGSFNATFTDNESGTEYQIEGEFAVER